MSLDAYLSATLRERIEAHYYAKVNNQARLEHLLRDPTFLATEDKNVGLFSDHGVVHVRDVAQQMLTVLARVHGVLIAQRPPARFHLMQGYGVLLAYLHDIGMFDFSPFGRAMHPEFAAQTIFRPEMDDFVAGLWQENSAGLAALLADWTAMGILPGPPTLRLREMLALAVCHSKSKVPTAVLNDPPALRQLMLAVISDDLPTLHARQRQVADQPWWAEATVPPLNADLHRHYATWPGDAFAWLVSPHPLVQALVVDLIDTARALRCADALRQRGTVLRTSGGYEIFMDQVSGRAIVALSNEEKEHFFLEIVDPISAGEANIASSELDSACDLRIAFHRGHFTTAAAIAYAAACVAHVVYDIQQDIIGSFARATPVAPALKTDAAMQILLEETDDQLDFAELVHDQLRRRDAVLAARVQVVPSLQQATEMERLRYLAAPPLAWTPVQCQACLAQIGTTGYRTERIDPRLAFAHVKLITLMPDELLLEGGAPAAFVYVPLQPGLRIFPLGGYMALPAPPWSPLGVTGVIRGASRNATIRAEATVQLLMIPKRIYLKYWYHAHTPASLLARLTAPKPT